MFENRAFVPLAFPYMWSLLYLFLLQIGYMPNPKYCVVVLKVLASLLPRSIAIVRPRVSEIELGTIVTPFTQLATGYNPPFPCSLPLLLFFPPRHASDSYNVWIL